MHYLPTTRLWDWLDSQSQSRVVCSRSDFCIRVKSLDACPPLYWQIVEIPGKAFYTSLQHSEQQQQQNREKSLELNFAQNSLTSKQNSFVIILCHFSLLSQIYKTFIIQCNQNVNGECKIDKLQQVGNQNQRLLLFISRSTLNIIEQQIRRRGTLLCRERKLIRQKRLLLSSTHTHTYVQKTS
jgi:hypothetical protein